MGKTKISDKNGRENTDNFYFLLLFLVGWDSLHFAVRPLLTSCTSLGW
jgi:hypothetical protein